jgi:hypothetical protein
MMQPPILCGEQHTRSDNFYEFIMFGMDVPENKIFSGNHYHHKLFSDNIVNIRVASHLRPFWPARVAQVRFTDQNERI